MLKPIDPSNVDSALWERVVQDDTGAFEAIVQRHQNAVSAIAFAIVGDFALCQDVAQETFWQAWRARRELRDSAKIAAWLCGIARNLAHQSLKRSNRERSMVDRYSREPSPQVSDPAVDSISSEERELVWNAIEDIPETYREALVLFYRQGQSVSEVALALDITEAATKQRLSRGRDQLREQLAATVEGVLVRSRPSRAFTTQVMAGITALTISMKSGAAAIAATGIASGKAAGLASTASQTAIGGGLATITSGGVIGSLVGLLGSAVGILGAWIGIWLPAQLAPTMAERQLLERFGKRQLFLVIVFTILNLVLIPILWLEHGWIVYAIALPTLIVGFIVNGMVQSFALQKQVQEIRRSTSPESDPNPSEVKTRINAYAVEHPNSVLNAQNWTGRQYTSQWSLFGIPCIDIQLGKPSWNMANSGPNESQPAFGWIAIGDQATGILLAMGGIAKGLVAFGGLAIGGLAFGGAAMGCIGIGGGALGILALGGGAIGYDAVGGGAIGWNSASGGLAIAYHAAAGGLAVAHDYAIGGQAIAMEANTKHAREVIQADSFEWMMDWYIANFALAQTLVIGLSITPSILLPWIYGRARKATTAS